MLENITPTAEKYESTIGNTTFTVVSKYIGSKPFLEYIKAAIKRDVEIAIHSKNTKAEEGISGEKEQKMLDL